MKARKKAVKIGASAAAGIAAALVGGYLLYQQTEPQRQKAKTWIGKARIEAAGKIKKLGRVSESEYNKIVDQAMRHYGSLAKANTAELVAAARDLKNDWNRIRTEVRKATVSKQVHAKRPARRKPARKHAKK